MYIGTDGLPFAGSVGCQCRPQQPQRVNTNIGPNLHVCDECVGGVFAEHDSPGGLFGLFWLVVRARGAAR